MGKRNKAELLTSNLAQLQNLIKRDKFSYHEEFLIQYRHFESSLEIFKLKPDTESIDFGEQIMFIAAVATCYPDDCKQFPRFLISMLQEHYLIMNPDLRKTMVQALILMRNRDVLTQTSLLSLFFTLFRCKDKPLRQLLHSHIVSDIKNSNAKSKNNKLNKTLQNFMYKMLQDTNENAAKKSLEVMVELYHKNVWNDPKTVNVIAEACVSNSAKLVAPSVHFFLGSNNNRLKDEEEEDEDLPDLNSLKHANGINKKRKSRQHQLEKAQSLVKRRERAKNRPEHFNFSALHLINDPQEFTEKLFSKLRQVTAKNLFNFELRLDLMNLISRMIGVHKLILLGFYDFLISYLKPHQKDVTRILAYAAQSSHDLVPPDSLETVVRGIADNFVWSNCASEVVAAGLNALREVCVRCPLAMPTELLQSLMEDYKNHREKGPMAAARSLLGLYRDFNPQMLKRKDRGKTASINMKNVSIAKYGQVEALDDVLDADLLELESDDEVVEDDPPTLIPNEESETQWEEIDDENEDQDVDSDDDANEEELSWEEVSDEDEESEEVSEDEVIEGEVLESEEEPEITLTVKEIGDDYESSDFEEEVEVQESPRPLKKQKVSLATQKIFTDEDFAKIKERREQREVERVAGFKTRNTKEENPDEDNDIVDVSKIMAFTKKKDDYAARMESIKEGREGRLKYGSKRGKEERASTTNREKSKKNKPMTMMVHKKAVKGKKQRSLKEKQKVLRAHITKQKKKGY